MRRLSTKSARSNELRNRSSTTYNTSLLWGHCTGLEKGGKQRRVFPGPLEAHEQMHQEIMETLKHEERKLNEKQKWVGSSTTKLKKII